MATKAEARELVKLKIINNNKYRVLNGKLS